MQQYTGKYRSLIGYSDKTQYIITFEEDEMHLFDQMVLGIAILFLLGILVIVKQVATGSILDKPKGNLLVQVVNIFNLFFCWL
jgi:hypothetical protein